MSLEDDSQTALVWKIRELTTENILLNGQLKTARSDSMSMEKRIIVEQLAMRQEIEWLKGELPHWYEKPAFVVPVAVLVTVWAVLRVVSVSL